MTTRADEFSTLPPPFRRARLLAFLAGLIGLAACLAVWVLVMILDRRWPQGAAAFYKAYLFGWLFFAGLSLGAMAAVMVHHLTGGEWGYFVRRPGEAAACVMPLMFVLFIPIFFGLHRLYPWATHHAHSAIVTHQRAYLNAPMFIGRSVIYFALWSAIAWLLRTFSLRHDRVPGKRYESALRALSAGGLVVYFIAMSLAAVDWIMSMNPDWYSTVFGLVVCLVQATSATAMLIILLDLISGYSPFVERVQPRHFNDLATLLITSVILWAYHSFSQLLVIWMGDIQHEISWYVQRSYGAWRFMAIVLIFVGFLVPFVLLLQRSYKRRGKVMYWICLLVLATQALDLYWMIAPSGYEVYPRLDWFNGLMSVIALIGIGGIWLGAFLWLLEGPPLIPMGAKVSIGAPSPESMHPDSGIVQHGDDRTQPGIA